MSLVALVDHQYLAPSHSLPTHFRIAQRLGFLRTTQQLGNPQLHKRARAGPLTQIWRRPSRHLRMTQQLGFPIPHRRVMSGLLTQSWRRGPKSGRTCKLRLRTACTFSSTPACTCKPRLTRTCKPSSITLGLLMELPVSRRYQNGSQTSALC
jgi:hypothetical protein